MSRIVKKDISEYGDFQTPSTLAYEVCKLLSNIITQPNAIIEPTCGVGNFLESALNVFSDTRLAFGADINSKYIIEAKKRFGYKYLDVKLKTGDFFSINWKQILNDFPDPILVIGNPPWVTNSHLSKLGSNNLPEKTNGNCLSGFEAISGKSNFDISEWMITHLIELLSGRKAVLAMLCKTSVARKVLENAWRSQFQLQSARMYLIDAQESFNASVDACLLVCNLEPGRICDKCEIFPNLFTNIITQTIGYRDGRLVSDLNKYLQWKNLSGPELHRWRSGIKHDCSAVMEVTKTSNGYINGINENVDIEDDYLFPLFKGSDIANGRIHNPTRYMLVTQKKIGENTRIIRNLAPKTWDYLESHASLLDNRRSNIYKRQPRFAIFGVGEYTFAPWKVAISGMYKQITFRTVPPFDNKPSVFDDTCCFLSCESEEEANYLNSLLNSEPANEFYSSLLFTDSKRPFTIDLLRRLDLMAVSSALGSDRYFSMFLNNQKNKKNYIKEQIRMQPTLF